MSRTKAGRAGRVFILAALLVLIAAILGAPSANASGKPPGNNGTVKVDGDDIGNGHDNDPHVGCEFHIEWFGFDEDERTSHVTFEAQPPSGNKVLLEDDETFTGNGSGNTHDHEQTYDLTPYLSGLFEHPQQGFHIKLTVETDGSQGADKKHKVFWVKGCEVPPPDTASITLEKEVDGNGIKPPNSTNFSFTIDCDDSGATLDQGSPFDLSVSDGETTVASNVAVNSSCTITETESNGADNISFTVDGSPAGSNGSVEVTPTTGDVHVVATNTYDPNDCQENCCEGECCVGDCGGGSGGGNPERFATLTLDKVVSGDDTPNGNPSYDFTVSCTDAGANVVAAPSIKASDDPLTVASNVSIGEQCTITETNTNGATSVSYTVNGAPVSSTNSVTVPVVLAEKMAVVADNDFVAPEVAGEVLTPPPPQDEVLGEVLVRPALARTGFADTARLLVWSACLMVAGLLLMGWSRKAQGPTTRMWVLESADGSKRSRVRRF